MKKIKIKIMIIVLLIIIIGILVLLFNNLNNVEENKEPQIVFKECNTFEYGDKVDCKSLVQSSNFKIISYPKIDSMKIGEQVLKFKGEDTCIKHKVIIKDTKLPEISFKQSSVSIEFGADYDISSNINSVLDHIDGHLSKSDTLKPGTYTITSDLNNNSAGKYVVTVCAMDKNKNKNAKEFIIVVKDKPTEPQDNNVDKPTVDYHEEVKPYYVNGVLLVNKKHAIPRSYGGWNDIANAALKQLQNAAATQGYSLPLISGYRSYDYQAQLYNNYVAIDGQEAADRYSAKPGTSEHQTGLAFDIGQIDYSFGETEAGKWLANHAHEYGFIIRYPEGKEHITGYLYEPWHVRYLGVDIATKVFNSGLTLEEFLGAM